MRSIVSPFAVCLFVMLGTALAKVADAQCPLSWSGSPQPFVSGSGKCSTVWDPDGTGPAVQRLVIGGSQLRGDLEPPGQRVMTWDGSQFEALGPGPGTNPTGVVAALLNWNGMLVAGGTFSGGGLEHIAQWNGSAWVALASGLPAAVTALTTLNGDLYAAGPSSNLIHRWNGASWTTLLAPPLLTAVHALTGFQGSLCVGGAGATTFSGVLERWNGTAWLPSVVANDRIECLAVRSFSLVSSLYVGGRFTNLGGVAAAHIAVSSGSTWLQVGNGLAAPCTHLHVRSISALNTEVVACIDTVFAPGVLRLVGASFQGLGASSLRSISLYSGAFHGASDLAGPTACLRFDSTNGSWVAVMGRGISGNLLALTASGNDMIVGGTFTLDAAIAQHHVARWDGNTFQTLGTGTGGAVEALITLVNGDVVAGGEFFTAGGVTVNRVARWNGSAWSAFGVGMNATVHAFAQLPNGDLIAAGSFTMAGGVPCARIARWNGSVWSPLGAGMNGDVFALAVRTDGRLFAGGSFSLAGGNLCNSIAQWDGATWSPASVGCNGAVRALAVRPNGDVIAVGSFTTAGGLPVGRCARWTGTAWASMGAASGDPSALVAVVALPNGDVVAGRGLHQPTTSLDEGLSRWDGTTWVGLGGGLAGFQSAPVSIGAIAQRANGELVVVGSFHGTNTVVANNVASLRSSCMPLAQPYGAGCSGGAGPLVLAADTLPWRGATLRTTTTGVVPFSLCLAATGFAPVSIPLPSILAVGQPGCSLLVSPDLLTPLFSLSTGTVTTTLVLNNNPSLLGAAFFQQAIPLEFSGPGVLTAVRASNALALTIGTL